LASGDVNFEVHAKVFAGYDETFKEFVKTFEENEELLPQCVLKQVIAC